MVELVVVVDDVVVVVVVVIIVVVIVIVVVVVVLFLLPLFLSLYLDFFFCQQEPTFIVKTDKGFELDCLTFDQFSWVKSSQIEASLYLVCRIESNH